MRLRSPTFAPRSAFGRKIGYLIALLVVFAAVSVPASAQAAEGERDITAARSIDPNVDK
jgi:hypothetical protein